MLENFSLLENLSPKMIAEIEESCEIKTYKLGESLIREGDETTEIYFLISGQVALYKIEPKTGNNLKFKEQSVGDSFGEMSFIDDSPRSCSVEAMEDTEVYVLFKDRLLKKAADAGEIINCFNQNVARQVNDRLRYLSDRYIVSLQKQIHRLEERNYYGSFFIFTGIYTGLMSLSQVVLSEVFPNYQFNLMSLMLASLIALAILAGPCFWIVKKFKIPFKKLGVTKKRLKKSLLDGVILSIIGVLGILGIAGILDLIYPNGQLLALFWKPLASVVDITSIAKWIYLPHSYVQEFVFRGVMLTSIKEFLSDKRGIFSVLLAAFFFGINHAPMGLFTIIGTFIGGVILGAIYLRTRNLVGVTILHYIFGSILISFS
ncbi:MAG: cyclic nucleotide-binding domain-containing protein [Spirulina sp.]